MRYARLLPLACALLAGLCGCQRLLGIEAPRGYFDDASPVEDGTRDGGHAADAGATPDMSRDGSVVRDAEADAAMGGSDAGPPDDVDAAAPKPVPQAGPIASVASDRSTAIFASSSWPDSGARYAPARAFDGDDTSAWCAAPVSGGPIEDGAGQLYDDEWRIQFLSPQTLGAIHMRSGWPRDDDYRTSARTLSHKVRDFSWWVRNVEGAWLRIPEASLYANRYQLIFRFAPIEGVTELRLLSRRAADELAFADVDGSNAPCLREVSFYAQRDALIDTPPWFYSIATWDLAAEPSAPPGNRYTMHRAFANRPLIDDLVRDLTGQTYADLEDHLWIGELNESRVVAMLPEPGPSDVAAPACPNLYSRKLRVADHDGTSAEIWDCALPPSAGFPDWVLYEPAPAGLLLSENFRPYAERSPALLSGLYYFLRGVSGQLPILAESGGHQLLAMAQGHATYAGFAEEFTGDHPEHLYRDCNQVVSDLGPGTNPNLCGERPDNGPHLLARAGSSDDMLFDLIPKDAPFEVFTHHFGLIVPDRLPSAGFDLIATYPGAAASTPATRALATISQAIKLQGRAVYGTQFRWHETTARGECSAARQNMETLFKNYLLVAMNRLVTPARSLSGTASGLDVLHDGSKAGVYCPHAGEQLSVSFAAPTPLRQLQLVSDPGTSIRFSYSADGHTFLPLAVSEDTSSARLGSYFQKRPEGVCAGRADDGAGTRIVTFDHLVTARALRLQLEGEAPCLRELNVLALAAPTRFDHPERWTGVAGDFDGDGRSDAAIFQRDDGRWRVRRSSDGRILELVWGEGGSASWLPVPADYDGDGITDPAVWGLYSGDFRALLSSRGFSYVADDESTFLARHWGDGGANDWLPIVGDYDGDGRADPAIWSKHDGTYWVLTSQAGFHYDADDRSSFLTGQWGAEGEAKWRPMPGDYDGDGRTDLAVWSRLDGRFRVLRSSDATLLEGQLGSEGDGVWLPVPDDYDGDGASDVAVWNRIDGEFWVARSSDAFIIPRGTLPGRWGFTGERENTPVTGHFSGDARADFAIYHVPTGLFWVTTPRSGFTWTPTDPASYMAMSF